MEHHFVCYTCRYVLFKWFRPCPPPQLYANVRYAIFTECCISFHLLRIRSVGHLIPLPFCPVIVSRFNPSNPPRHLNDFLLCLYTPHWPFVSRFFFLKRGYMVLCNECPQSVSSLLCMNTLESAHTPKRSALRRFQAHKMLRKSFAWKRWRSLPVYWEIAFRTSFSQMPAYTKCKGAWTPVAFVPFKLIEWGD